jgi:type IV pilus assembly protein PilW
MKKQRGLTLVELMVAMTLGLFVTGAVIAVFLSSSQTYRVQDSFARVQESARFSLAMMERDIRMAGYRGCLGGLNGTVPVINTLASPTPYANKFAIGLQGFEFDPSSAGWLPALDATISGATPAPAPGSDIITVRMAVGAGTPLTAVMANASTDIPVASTAGLLVGSPAMVSDCVASTVFQVTGFTGTNVSHATPNNATANLGRAFGADANVMRVCTISYYVGPSSNAPTGTETSLWRIDAANPPEELIEGVESMQILYGEDTNGDLAPDHYVTSNNIANSTR